MGRAPSRSESAYIDNSAERSDSICSVDVLFPTSPPSGARNILHHTARHHNHILGGVCQLLDHQVNHLPQARIAVLEQLCDSEEELCRLSRREALSRVEEICNLCQKDAALAGRDWRCVEDSGCKRSAATPAVGVRDRRANWTFLEHRRPVHLEDGLFGIFVFL